MELDLVFTVDSTNGNGLGVRTIKSNGYVENVFMHTSSTPGKGIGGFTNPNPQAGFAYIQFKNNFNYYIGGFSGTVAPLTSTSTTALTAGNVYVITSLGTTTQAQWQTAGLTPGFTAQVGSAFVAAASASLSGTGTVGIPGNTTIQAISIVGDPSTTISNSSIAANGGALILVQFLGATSSSVTTPIPTAPANNSVVALTFKFDCSSVSIPDGGPSNTGTGGL
jgi:hypothetical protein